MSYFSVILWYLVLYIISNVLVFCIVDNKNLQCVSVETPNHPLSPPRLLLSSRGWAEPEPKLSARIEILIFVWRLTEIPAFRLQLSGRKPEEHSFTFTLNFLIRYTGRIYSSCSLPDSCNGNAGISSSLQTETRISIPAQSFGSGSAQPLLRPHICNFFSTQIFLHTNLEQNGINFDKTP